ncbi:S1 family peptidase [Kitasatospora sp. NPDC086009]|uniref:S1 family peptidase n=1 Tax=Kitasatospora sp. NPDC086009 TaxID=3364065 RepID=UPI0037C7D5F9
MTAAMLPQSAGAAAAPTPEPMAVETAVKLSETLTDRLGTKAAGAYYDSTAGKLVVNTTDQAQEDAIRAAGAEPRTVKFSQEQLDAAQRVLDAKAAIPGTAWGSDPRTNKLVVTADETVTAASLDRLKAVAEPYGDMVVVERTQDKLAPMLMGGDAVYSSIASTVVGRCSLGFNVKRFGKPDAFLTAGHCGKVIKSWSRSEESGEEMARVPEGGSSYPGTDYAIAEYNELAPPHPSEVNLYDGDEQVITQARAAIIGEPVRASGASTGLGTGVVLGTNFTANYPDGQVTHLIRTSVCRQAGDSGGPLFFGHSALGIMSGGSGTCTVGLGQSYYQPVLAALAAYGATITS